MSLVVSNGGELLLLEWAIKSTSTPEDLVLKLYKNNYNPVAASNAGNFTEADFTDYTSKSLTRTNWSSPSTDINGKGATSYSAQSWVCGATGNTVYGYYVVGSSSGTLIWAEKFGTARVLSTGDTLIVNPSLTFNSEA